MKAHLIDKHLLVPRSKSSAKVKVKYKDYISPKKAVLGHLCFTNTSCFPLYTSQVCVVQFAKMQNLRGGGCWVIFIPRTYSHCDRIHSSLTADRCFSPVTLKEWISVLVASIQLNNVENGV